MPRLYSPSRRPSFSVATSFEPYSSKLNVSVPFSKVPLVEVTFSSPLKNDPWTPAAAAAISNRNGISIVLTTTVASHSPASDWAAAAGSIKSPAAANSRPATTADLVLITAPAHAAMRANNEKIEKARKASRLPGLQSAEKLTVPSVSLQHEPAASWRKQTGDNTGLRPE